MIGVFVLLYSMSKMSESGEPLIVLTNDDGIHSPGLLAAAEALAPLGWGLVAAPSEQQSGSGRSMTGTADIVTERLEKVIDGNYWEVYAVRGTPAQAVQQALLVLSDCNPDLVVSGINYGENVGSGITISGTVGAALEGASFGIPALAVSQEMNVHYQLSHSEEVDFSAAKHFTRLFARRLLSLPVIDDVDVLKVEVPSDATGQTPWRVTRQSRQKYYVPLMPDDRHLESDGQMPYRRDIDFAALELDSDISVLVKERSVSVTPISLDLTSRVGLDSYEKKLRDFC